MFVFKLQAVLDTKKIIEEQKLTDFSEKKNQLNEEKKVLNTIQQERILLVDQLRDSQHLIRHMRDIELQITYIDVCKEKEKKQKKVIDGVTKEVEERRIALMEAMKERKVMENLKDRDMEEFKDSEVMQERIATDETAILRFRRTEG
ncbi:MAG TPA: flagellar export protein FliJ [Syntrophus sp. (in: bacteria)]|jgi:flagellar FliJ protein|nr:flagellar export protein FliJ [Syntrophus sp. (in: bacteria)]